MAEELTTLTINDVLAPNLLELAFGVQYIEPKPLTATIYNLPIQTEFLYNQILNVTKTPLGVHCEWRPEKSLGVRRLFNFLFKAHPVTKHFVSISHTSIDVKNTTKDLCLLRQRCAAYVDGCTTRWNASWSINSMLDTSTTITMVKFECVANTYSCHQHHPGRIYGQIRDPIRQQEIALEEPRISQIKSLKQKPFNPYSTKRDYHPSHSAAKSIRHKFQSCDLYEELLKLQDEDEKMHMDEPQVSMMRKGHIHELKRKISYLTVSMWSRESILLFIALAIYGQPGIFIDSTEKLVKKIDGRNSITYKMRIPSPTKKGFITFWECTANRKNSQIFICSFIAFDENVKEYYNGLTFSPGAATMDDWPPFAKTLCLRWNLKPLQQYLNEEHRRFMGFQGIPKNNTILILGLIHIKKSIKQKFNYSKARDISQFPMKIRKRIKYLAYDVIKYIAGGFNNLLVIQSIQIFNILTKSEKFSLKQENNVSHLFWQHPILCPFPQIQYQRHSSFKFEEIEGQYHYATPFPLCQMYVIQHNDNLWTFNLIFLRSIKQFIQINVDNEYNFDNPYFMPCGAEYMNEKKFNRIALFSRICVGMTRDRTTNQTIEGTFNVDKNHPIELKRNLRLHEYVKTTLKYEKYQRQHYFQECVEAKNIECKQELDKTRKSKIILSEREMEIHEKFDRYLRIKYEGKYSRSAVKKDYESFYKNVDHPDITLNKISDLKSRKHVTKANDWIGYVEKWLDHELNGA